MLFVTDGTIMSGLNPEFPELELPEWHEDVKVLKGFFSRSYGNIWFMHSLEK